MSEPAVRVTATDWSFYVVVNLNGSEFGATVFYGWGEKRRLMRKIAQLRRRVQLAADCSTPRGAA